MTMSPGLRRAVLTVHIVSSVGWLGAVLAYIALDVTATFSEDAALVRAAYVAMDVLVTAVVLPLALASTGVGIGNALGTTWGLFRHYWVLLKLALTLVATTVLILETPTIRNLADTARTVRDPGTLPGSLPHSIGGLLVLLVLTAVSLYKPRGVTPYGWRKRREQREVTSATATS